MHGREAGCLGGQLGLFVHCGCLRALCAQLLGAAAARSSAACSEASACLEGRARGVLVLALPRATRHNPLVGHCCRRSINLWLGDERSTTSWHKDPFENLYAGERPPIMAYYSLPSAAITRLRLPARQQPALYPVQEKDGWRV